MVRKFIDIMKNPNPDKFLSVWMYKHYLLITAGVIVSGLTMFFVQQFDTVSTLGSIILTIVAIAGGILGMVSVFTLIKLKWWLAIADFAIVVGIFVLAINFNLRIPSNYIDFVLGGSVICFHLLFIIGWSLYLFINKSTREKIIEVTDDIQKTPIENSDDIILKLKDLEKLYDIRKNELEKKIEEIEKEKSEILKKTNPYPEYIANSDNFDFFVPPPDNIGRITHAYTTLRKTENPIKPHRRILWILAGIVIGVVVALTIQILLSPSLVWNIIWYCLFSVVSGIIAFNLTDFIHECSYVGTEGFAFYKIKNNRNSLVEEDIIKFSDVNAIVRDIIPIYDSRGIFQKTQFMFAWNKGADVIYAYFGSIPDQDGHPILRRGEAHRLYWLASAESAWEEYLLPKVIAEIEINGRYRFIVRDWGAIDLWFDSISFIQGYDTIKWNFNDIKYWDTDNGSFRFYHNNFKPGIFSNSGDIISIPALQTENFMLFLKLSLSMINNSIK
jgi:hypothetical protein